MVELSYFAAGAMGVAPYVFTTVVEVAVLKG